MTQVDPIIEAARARLEAERAAASAELRAFPKDGPMGLTPDAVKATPEWRAASARYQAAHEALRQFNQRHKPKRRGRDALIASAGET